MDGSEDLRRLRINYCGDIKHPYAIMRMWRGVVTLRVKLRITGKAEMANPVAQTAREGARD